MAGVQAIFDRYGRPLNTFIVSCRTAPHPNSPVSTAQQAPGLLLPPPPPPPSYLESLPPPLAPVIPFPNPSITRKYYED